MLLVRRIGPQGILAGIIISIAIIAGIGMTIYLMDMREKAAITPEDLFRAVNQGDMTRIIECLKAKPELAKAKDGKGQTALHIAAGKDLGETTRLLLNMGADPAAKNADGKTPLEVAKEKNCGGAAAILSQSGSK